MSAAQLYSGLKKLVKERHGENKMLESMLEAMEEMQNIESQVSTINKQRAEVEASYNSASQKMTEYREYIDTESRSLGSQLQDKRGETQDAMDDLDAQLDEKRTEYNNEMDVMELTHDELKKQLEESAKTARAGFNEKMEMLAHKTEAHMEAMMVAKTKKAEAEADLKAFVEKHAE